MISSPNIFFTPFDALPPITLYNLVANIFFNASESFINWSSISWRSILSWDFALLSFIVLLKRDFPITTPWSAGFVLSDASFTSPAFSPKIALSNFSSGVGSDSPLGVILPIKISPVFV